MACGHEDELGTAQTATERQGSAQATDRKAGSAADGSGENGQAAADGGGTGDRSPVAGGPGGAGGDQAAVAADRPLSIEDVTEAVMTGSLPAELICDALVTERLVAEAYGGRGGCLAAQQPGALARELPGGVDARVQGAGATASVTPAGGPYDGIEVEVILVPDGELDGAWRVDALRADVPAGP